MNFFERQALARRESRWILMLLWPTIILTIAAANLVFLVPIVSVADVDTLLLGGVAISTTVLGIILAGIFERRTALQQGGVAIALEMGGTFIKDDVTDFYLQRLRNVVEEVAIASPTPVPYVFVMEKESGINVFSAGTDPSRMVIVVTQGALQKLNRDELQGMIAHEFSHILNGDTCINIRLAELVFGFYALARLTLFLWKSKNRNAGALAFLTLPLLPIGYLGLYFARWIKAGVNRQREFLADASAVQFTRQTEGIVGALKKAAALREQGLLVNVDAEQISHMLICDGTGYKGRLASHPPLIERLQALEPGIKANDVLLLGVKWRLNPPVGLEEDRKMGLRVPEMAILPPVDAIVRLQSVAKKIGTQSIGNISVAKNILAGIPADLHLAASSSEQSPLLMLALLLDSGEKIRQSQIQLIGQHYDAGQVSAYVEKISSLNPMLSLPLVLLALPTLELKSKEDKDVLLQIVQKLIDADSNESLFEYCLGILLKTHLQHLVKHAAIFSRKRKLTHAIYECELLLATLAWAGNPNFKQANAAFANAVAKLYSDRKVNQIPAPVPLSTLNSVWAVLDGLEPFSKELLVEALALAIAHDGVVTLEESELFRTIGACLHCPIPAFLETAI